MQSLMNKTIEKRFEKIGNQDHEKDPIIVERLFVKDTTVNMFMAEYDKEKKVFFGYLSCENKELNGWRYISLEELMKLDKRGISIIRDDSFEPQEFSKILSQDGEVVNES